MPRAEQTVSYSISPVVPTTTGKLPVFATTGNPSKATDSVFGQADAGHQVIIGAGASVNAGQVATKPVVVIGDGAIGWGDGAIVIGKNAGNPGAAQDNCVSIGTGAASKKNSIIVSTVQSAATFENTYAIGAAAGAARNGDIAIGTAASADGANVGTWPGAIVIGNQALCNEGPGVAIGQHARIVFSGLGTSNQGHVAIGQNAIVQVTFGSPGCIAIGQNAFASGTSTIAIGANSSATGNGVIAIGVSAASARANECVIGDNTNGPITLFTVRPGAANPVLHRVGGNGVWGIRDGGDANTIFQVDSSAAAGDIRLLVWDVTAGIIKRVTMAAAGAAPAAGFRALQVPV
jgi:hypothetical protein